MKNRRNFYHNGAPMRTRKRILSVRFDGFAETLVVSPSLVCKGKSSFTLAETMIVLIVLGIVATIAVPSMVKKHIDAANKTKVKKALATYERLMTTVVADNNVTNSDKLRDKLYGENRLTDAKPDCSRIHAQLRPAQYSEVNSCVFSGTDGVWYVFGTDSHVPNNTDPKIHTYVALNKEDANYLYEQARGNNGAIEISYEPVFEFAATFDGQKRFHMNDDVAFGTTTSNQEHLFGYFQNKKNIAYNIDKTKGFKPSPQIITIDSDPEPTPTTPDPQSTPTYTTEPSTSDPTTTTEPTDDPTVDPTDDPTVDPTGDPTVEPTDDPTVDPTDDPTVDPTDDPTVEPTDDPTVDPTDDPTVDPTDDPTDDNNGGTIIHGDHAIRFCETNNCSVYDDPYIGQFCLYTGEFFETVECSADVNYLCNKYKPDLMAYANSYYCDPNFDSYDSYSNSYSWYDSWNGDSFDGSWEDSYYNDECDNVPTVIEYSNGVYCQVGACDGEKVYCSTDLRGVCLNGERYWLEEFEVSACEPYWNGEDSWYDSWNNDDSWSSYDSWNGDSYDGSWYDSWDDSWNGDSYDGSWEDSYYSEDSWYDSWSSYDSWNNEDSWYDSWDDSWNGDSYDGSWEDSYYSEDSWYDSWSNYDSWNSENSNDYETGYSVIEDGCVLCAYDRFYNLVECSNDYEYICSTYNIDANNGIANNYKCQDPWYYQYECYNSYYSGYDESYSYYDNGDSYDGSWEDSYYSEDSWYDSYYSEDSWYDSWYESWNGDSFDGSWEDSYYSEDSWNGDSYDGSWEDSWDNYECLYDTMGGCLIEYVPGDGYCLTGNEAAAQTQTGCFGSLEDLCSANPQTCEYTCEQQGVGCFDNSTDDSSW